MGRSESKAAYKQSSTQSAEDQANATAAFQAANKSLGDYSTRLNNFMKYGRDVYGAGGEFARDQNAIGTQTAAAGSNAIKGNIALRSMATGENTGGEAGTIAEAQRNAQRDLTGQLANADATRLQNLTQIQQTGLQASALPAQVNASLYGTGTSGATGQGGNMVSAAKQPGFWDEFGGAVIGAGGAAAKGAIG